jgi:hypothetical protein
LGSVNRLRSRVGLTCGQKHDHHDRRDEVPDHIMTILPRQAPNQRTPNLWCV